MIHPVRSGSLRPATAALAALIAVAAASPAAAARGDPLEPMNRGLFAINRAFDRAIGRPIAMTYRRLLPGPLRRAAHNVLSNLGEPIVAANDLLQLRIPQAGRTAARFTANTTVGILGVFDVAAHVGLPHHDNSFGDTLGRAHVPPGPYLYIPIVGPSTLRDLIGDGVDIVLDPLTQVRHLRSRSLEATELGLGALDQRVQEDQDLKDLEAGATDPYATLRSVYLQTTAARIRGVETPELLPELPPEAPVAPTPAPPAQPAPSPAAPREVTAELRGEL